MKNRKEETIFRGGLPAISYSERVEREGTLFIRSLPLSRRSIARGYKGASPPAKCFQQRQERSRIKRKVCKLFRLHTALYLKGRH